MDWIQIYLIIMLVINATMITMKHGTPSPNHNVWAWLIALVLALPWIGRVFTWW